MVNKNLFLGKMVSRGYTQISLSHAVGTSKNTMNAKINNRRPFDSDEILRICEVLGIRDDREKVKIFLTNTSHFRDESPAPTQPKDAG